MVSFNPDDEDVGKFEALSYFWGSEEDPIDVFIGEGEEVTLAVTGNLAEALPYLRYTHKPQAFWIDAICVNQKDLVERSKQVGRMADIYSKADSVVVWLGPESYDSDIAIACIEEIAGRIKVNFSLQVMEPTTEETHWGDARYTLPFKRREFRALSNLLGRNWFQRLWVWQEVHLATHNPVVMCGFRRISWSGLRKAVFGLFAKPRPTSSADVVVMEHLRTAYSLMLGQDSNQFDRLLYQTRHTKCTDPRDRVFALCSLSRSDHGMLEMQTDFTKEVHEVYQDAMLHWTRKTRCLNLLCMVEMHEHLKGVPSWIPDWSTKRLTKPLPYGLAGGLTESLIPSDVNHILPAMGVIVGEVKAAEDFDYSDDGDAEMGPMARELCRVVSRLDITGPFIPGSKLAKNLCVVVVGNRYLERFFPPNTNELPFEDIEKTLCHALNYVFGWTEHITRGKETSLYTTTDGRFGLAPAKTLPGDVVASLLGCPSAMILRPVQDGKYQVIGEALCQGFMYGEGLLGPLPEHVEPILYYADNLGEDWWAFLNQETTEFLPEDPRLGELPKGWMKTEHEYDKTFSIFVHEGTEERLYNVDPRMTPESLRERGVDLKTFELV
ncbi:uncharacterized protein LY89DRAFT_587862 [Mollisia scopiformis]|uniref:Heterokaryon incompatibility domain-containing protein n=1 Tax=Mollisia scopiformis TaxID=149040 RepID=A0A194X4Y1_MOLSC|nr:uncharacterized protein LY89DRAFT_587862 [Mollisia scopiformis]KUJ15235.1 hypothetical protein LY89DRAFT_587862 [Mollisia scopiformis]